MWVGADPGGKGKFGLALLGDDGCFTARCISCAKEAADHVIERPKGVGIDAPMWWSSGPSGDRMADQWIRKRYRLAAGTVQAANSLRGAALVQAALFAELVRQRFPEVPITESHPKAVLKALQLGWREFCEQYRVTGNAASEHENDAVVAAVTAREGFEHRWRHDLVEQRHLTEQDPSRYWLAPMHYFWPE